MTGVQDLLRHLKANPGDRDAAALSARFGVDSRLVEMAVNSLPKESVVKTESRHPVKEAWSWVSKAWRSATKNIVLFLVLTSVLAFLCFFFSDSVKGVFQTASGFHVKVSGILAVFTLVVIPAIQFAALAKCDRYRYAILGALLFGTATGFATRFGGAGIALGLMYLIAAAPFVVGGSYLRMRREGRATENLSRQELLERLLTVRTALSEATTSAPAAKTKGQRFQAYLEKNVIWIAFLFSLVQSAAASLLLASIDPGRKLLLASASASKSLPSGLSIGLLIAIGFVSISSYLAQFLVGFLAVKFTRSLWVMLAFVGSYALHFLTPWSYVTFAVLSKVGYGNLIAGCFTMAVLILIGNLTRQLYDYAAVKARRGANDPETLMSEMIELEWRLTPKSSRVTVLAVDVAGSTAMKRDADPMVTEWSFREYQKWVERVCAKYGGKVESTAGDGAIVGFVDPGQALSAATAIQSEVDEFNRSVNRMSVPFRLRIGLHTGDVQGDLGDVQFTRVIDVAAHIESKAPIGGIAVSETMTESLGGRSVQKAAVTTDGHDVYFLNDPLVPPASDNP